MRDTTFHAPAARLGWFSELVLAAATAAPQPLRVLDLGCGSGDQIFDLADRRPDARFTGVDLAPANIAAAESRRALRPYAARFTFTRADLLDFDPAGTFDLVISYSVLQEIPAPIDRVVTGVARCLAPGGAFAYTIPYRCTYNRTLAVVRGALRRMHSDVTDRLLFAVARALHGGALDESLLRERLPYAYLVPFRYDEDVAAMGQAAGLQTVSREHVPHASPAQMKHALRVMRHP